MRFVPAVAVLECRAATAPMFVTDRLADDPVVDVSAITESSCLLGGPFGGTSDDSGLQDDPVGMTTAASLSLPFSYIDPDAGLILDSTETGMATATITGPSGTNPLDTRPVATPTVTISAAHQNQDRLTNYTGNWIDITSAATYETTVTQGVDQLAIAGDVNQGSIVRATFTAHFDCDSPNSVVLPQLHLTVGQNPTDETSPPVVAFNIDGSGASAEYVQLGILDKADASFGSGPSNDFTATLTFSVQQGDKLPVDFYSSLWSSPSGLIAPGPVVTNSNFSWSLTLTAQGGPPP
jgi:hypothetical protein